MAFTLYKSTDAGAPVLSGATDTLIALLTACLVDGYGAKAAAGWTRPYYDATNDLAVFKADDAQDFFIHIDDGGPGSHTFREARIHCGMNHDGSGTLTNTAPQNLGYPNGWFIRKSAAVSATAREWQIYADGKTVYLFIIPGDTANRWLMTRFGKCLPLSATEAYPWMLDAQRTEAENGWTVNHHTGAFFLTYDATLPNAASPVHADGSATATGLYGIWSSQLTQTYVSAEMGIRGSGFPAPRTGLAPLWDGALAHDKEPRLKLRGMISAYALGAVAAGDTFTATIGGIARDFIALRVGLVALVIIETSDTLDL